MAAVQARLQAPAARPPAAHVQRALAAVQAKAAPGPPVQPPPASLRLPPPPAQAVRPAAPPLPPPRPAVPAARPAVQPALARAGARPASAAVVQPGGKWNKRRRDKPRAIDLEARYLAEGEEADSSDLFGFGRAPAEEVETTPAERKRALLGVPAVDEETAGLINRMIDSESIDEDDLVLSRRGRRGRFDVVSPRPLLFWRGDSRSPAQVLRTGFSSRLERELRAAGESTDLSAIIWRASQDDIVNETAVCVARDVRGSMFFPLETAASIYLYAVALDSYVDTRRAQMLAEAVETGAGRKGRRKWRQRSRYRYDRAQGIAQGGEGGAVWQYGEVATYEVAAEYIVGAWKVDRQRITGSSSSMSGIRFLVRTGNLIKQNFKDAGLATLKRQAETLVAPYKDWYPRGVKYLSYQGIVSEETPDENAGPRRSRSEVFSRAPKAKKKKPRQGRPRPQGRGRMGHR